MSHFRILSEWDISNDGVIFKSVEAANKWLLENETLVECYEEGLTGQAAIDDLISAGLITIESLIVYGEE